MLRAECLVRRAWLATRTSSAARSFHAAAVLRQAEGGEGSGDEGAAGSRGGGGAGAGGGGAARGPKRFGEATVPLEERRVGRPFLDPRAPRRLESLRSDPMHQSYGGLVDILEHSAYCDGQREEQPEGFFFDNTRPEYDSDCDGDPFAASYLTEDEIEFPEEYTPTPYIPGRVHDAMWFLYTAKKWPVARIASKYALTTARVSGILNLKAGEGAMKATGRYDPRLDEQLSELYAGRFGTAADKTLPGADARAASGGSPGGRGGWDDSLDMGARYEFMRDEVDVEGAMPTKAAPDGGRYGGHELRINPGLPTRAAPPKAERVHDSKFVFRDISSATRKTPNGRRAGPLLTSDWNGAVRLSSNTETLYRSWEPRRWSLRAAAAPGQGSNYPFPDADGDKTATFRLRP